MREQRHIRSRTGIAVHNHELLPDPTVPSQQRFSRSPPRRCGADAGFDYTWLGRNRAHTLFVPTLMRPAEILLMPSLYSRVAGQSVGRLAVR